MKILVNVPTCGTRAGERPESRAGGARRRDRGPPRRGDASEAPASGFCVAAGVPSAEQLGPSPQNHRATHELHRAARCSVQLPLVTFVCYVRPCDRQTNRTTKKETQMAARHSKQQRPRMSGRWSYAGGCVLCESIRKTKCAGGANFSRVATPSHGLPIFLTHKVAVSDRFEARSERMFSRACAIQ